MRPEGLTKPAARSSTASCSLSRRSRLPGRTRHFASGFRRQVADAGARRIDQHEIGYSFEAREGLITAKPRRSHLDIPRARALEPSMDRRQASPILIGRDDAAFVSRQGGERQRLAATAGAQIDRGLSRLYSGEQRDELRALVLDFDEAFEEGGLGLHGRPAPILPMGEAQPERRERRRGRDEGARAPPSPLRACLSAR